MKEKLSKVMLAIDKSDSSMRSCASSLDSMIKELSQEVFLRNSIGARL